MTANRSQKAEIRAFAADRDVSYTEARRLMGLDELRWDATDEASGVSLEATMDGNVINLRWDYPDGSVGDRAVRTHVLLDLGIWPGSKSSKPFLLTEHGELRGAWNESPVLPRELTDRLREWVAKIVQKPEVLSKDEEQFLYFSRQPEDYVVAVTDRAAKSVVIHVFRNPNPVEAPDASPQEIVAEHAKRYRAFEEAVAPTLAAQYPGRDLTDPEDLYTFSAFPRAGEKLSEIFRINRFVAGEELRHGRAGKLDPAELEWSIVEHIEF